MSDPRLDLLLDHYVQGTLSETERQELERTLLSSAPARAAFWQQARGHALLARWGQETWGQRRASDALDTDGANGTPQATAITFPRWWFAAGTIAAACVLVIVMITQSGLAPATTTPGVAVLTSAVGVEWVDPANAPGAGSVLVPGLLALKSGAVQVEFYSGARVVIEGPARLRLVSDLAAQCDLGSVNAHVPPQARGFAITTPGLTVTDLGTEFGLRIPEHGQTEVHVFTGLVEVSRSQRTTPTMTLTEGKAIRVESDQLTVIPADRGAFLNESGLAHRVQADAGRLQDRWRQSASLLSRDPATVVHFTCEGDQRWERMLTNHASATGGSTQASIVGSTWVEGRWPGKGALEFKGNGDRVRFDVPGTFQTMSLIAWVRIDTLMGSQATLMASSELKPGIFRWSLLADGALRLGISKTSLADDSNWEAVNSPALITPDLLRTWVMLASVFDGSSIRHYRNGRLAHTGAALVPFPLQVNVAELGNWRGGGSHHLQGRLDQFVLMTRALSHDEVLAVYEAGKPASSAP